MWKHKESKWLVRGGRKVKCYLCGKKILASGDLFLFHGDTGYYSHQSCQAESTTISGNERRRAVKKIAVGAAVVGAIAAGAGKFLDVSSQSKNSPAAQTILTSQGLIPPALTSDPSNPVPGQMWYRSDAGVEAHFDGVQNRVVYSSEINDGNVHVTSKGIINGLSVLPNDGTGWFGPDTTSGATAPGQYGSPYTKEYGIQESVNYAVNNAGGKIYLIGNFNFGNYMPYIVFPDNTSNTPIPISIEGGGTGTIDVPFGTFYGFSPQYITGLSILYVNILSLTNSVPSNFMFTVPPGYNVKFKDIITTFPPASSPNLNPINGFFTIKGNTSAYFYNVSVQPYTDPSASGYYYSNVYGFYLNTPNYDVVYDNCNALGLNFGFTLGAHTYCNNCDAIWDYIGYFFVYGDHPSYINNSLAHACIIVMGSNVGTIVTVYGNINIEWYTSGYWQTLALYSTLGIAGTVFYGHLYAQGHPYGDNGSQIIPLSFMPSGHYIVIDQPVQPAPTTPSVPASGTAQQNTNPYAVNVYVYGGVVTEIQITKSGIAYTIFSNSTGVAMSGQHFPLKNTDSITVTYTTAPTWEWLSD